LINSWRRAGFELVYSLLYSGVLVGSSARRHPSDLEERDPMAAYLQSIEPPTKAMTIRQSAEREVAHALCAQERGFRGRHRRDRRQRGSDPLDAATRRSPIQVAAVIVAPEVWVNVHRSGTFTRGGTGCEQDRRAWPRGTSTATAPGKQGRSPTGCSWPPAPTFSPWPTRSNHTTGVVDLSDE
jgi:hypothetical protein